MDFKLIEFVINNIILRDEINSYYLIKIIEFYKIYNKKVNIDISNINFNIEHIEKLKKIYLNFDNNQIHNIYHQGFNEIIDVNNFTNLKKLDLEFNRNIKDCHIKNLYSLEKLSLPKNKLLTNKGIINLNELKYIDLSFNKNINNEAIKNKKNLEYLKLIHNKKINDEAFTNIKKLKCLNLGYNNNRKLNLNFLKYNNNIEEVILFRKKNLSEDVKNILINLKNVICLDLQYTLY